MGYQERFTKAEKAGQTASVTPKWVAFDKEGESVCGKLLGTVEVASGLGSGIYLQYLMETDDGLIKFSLGAATDKELKTVLHTDGIYKITYVGQQKIKGGRRVNRFQVIALLEAEEKVDNSDVPF